MILCRCYVCIHTCGQTGVKRNFEDFATFDANISNTIISQGDSTPPLKRLKPENADISYVQQTSPNTQQTRSSQYSQFSQTLPSTQYSGVGNNCDNIFPNVDCFSGINNLNNNHGGFGYHFDDYSCDLNGCINNLNNIHAGFGVNNVNNINNINSMGSFGGIQNINHINGSFGGIQNINNINSINTMGNIGSVHNINNINGINGSFAGMRNINNINNINTMGRVNNINRITNRMYDCSNSQNDWYPWNFNVQLMFAILGQFRLMFAILLVYCVHEAVCQQYCTFGQF